MGAPGCGPYVRGGFTVPALALTRQELLARWRGARSGGLRRGKKKRARPHRPGLGRGAGAVHARPGRAPLRRFLFASHPRSVRDAIASATAPAWTPAPRAYVHENEAPARRRGDRGGRRYLGVPKEQLAFTDSTTMGLGLVYAGCLKPGTRCSRPSTTSTRPRVTAAERGERPQGRASTTIRRRRRAEEMLERLRDAITPRTEVLAVTCMHSGTGVQLPLADRQARPGGGARQRPRAGRRGRAARRGRRRLRRRHAQVARRPARDRRGLGAGAGTR